MQRQIPFGFRRRGSRRDHASSIEQSSRGLRAYLSLAALSRRC
jgi:hypothetical protein